MTKKPEIDTRLDKHGRREFCDEGHRIIWTQPVTGYDKRVESIGAGGGICAGGQTWRQERAVRITKSGGRYGGRELVGYRTPKLESTNDTAGRGELTWQMKVVGDGTPRITTTVKCPRLYINEIAQEVWDEAVKRGYAPPPSSDSGERSYADPWPHVLVTETPQSKEEWYALGNKLIQTGWDIQRVLCPTCLLFIERWQEYVTTKAAEAAMLPPLP